MIRPETRAFAGEESYGLKHFLMNLFWIDFPNESVLDRLSYIPIISQVFVEHLQDLWVRDLIAKPPVFLSKPRP